MAAFGHGDVLVLGGGPAGCAAAIFAARHGHRVVVVDQDPTVPTGSAHDVLRDWPRHGVGQARQGHLFLARSTTVLRTEAPDVVDSVVASGATEVPVHGCDDGAILARRLVYEAALRRCLAGQAGVTVVGDQATGLILDRRGEVPSVAGVSTASNGVLRAGLVVDAMGRRSRTSHWLQAAGLPALSETSHATRFHYVTRHFALRRGAMFPTTDVPLVALLPYATVIVFPGDNATFQISVVVSQDDEAWRGLRRDRIFDALVAEIPLTQPWIGSAEATSDPLPFPSIENRWRRVTNGNAPCVLGLVLLGDAAMQTNPTLGRGVSMAFMHAQHLVRELDAYTGDPWDLVVSFERWTTEHFGPWFETQVALDEKRSVELAAGASSTEPSARPDPVHGFLDALDALRSDDPLVRVAYDRVYHLIDPPYALFRNRELVKRVAASARRRDWLRSRPAGPDHERFRRILVS